MSMALFATMRVVSAIALCVVFVGAVQAQVSPPLAQKAPAAAEMAARAAQRGYVRVIVQFAAPDVPTELRPNAEFLAPIKTQIASLQNTIIASHFGSATSPREGQGFSRNLVRLEIRPLIAVNVSLTELDELAADPRIVFIQYDRLARPSLPQSVPLIGMPAVYQAGGTGLRQAVAVLDTGAQANHQFLSGNMLLEACFSGGDGVSLCPSGQMVQFGPGASDPTTAQCISSGPSGNTTLCDHGTHVAGIAAGNNTIPEGGPLGAPTNGVAKSARIISIQVFSRFNDAMSCGGAPPCVGANTSNQIQALDWLFQNALTPASGVALASVNMSLGDDTQNPGNCDAKEPATKASIDSLRSEGVPTLIAAGNDGYTAGINIPACISTAVAVASSDKADRISSFTNMSAQVALIAPGGFGGNNLCQLGANNANILSSISVTSSSIINQWNCFAGTSMAAPHVAGAFAAIRTVCPNATIDRILAALENTGVPIPDTRSGGTVTKNRIRVDLALKSMGCARHDFNADGTSDIAWRNTNGDTAIWLMSVIPPGGAQVLSAVDFGIIDNSWQIVGQRDFNGDGNADLLWRNTNGDTSIWLMTSVMTPNGQQLQVLSTIHLGFVGNGWSIVGTGDFNGDGYGDILWRNANGDTSIWLMTVNGTQVQVLSTTDLGLVPTSWSVVQTGDFNGDGMADILWSNTNGDTSIWLMTANGTQMQVLSVTDLGVVPTSWNIAGTGDFNGDGKSDILWRNTNGDTSIWLMTVSGTQVRVSSTNDLGSVPTSWGVAVTGDFNGDGMSDILWRNTNGDTSIWFMNGTLVSSVSGLGVVPNSWVVQAAGAN
jgi:hypothetical protein